MAHEIVFGVCEDKCPVEVDPKSKTSGALVANSLTEIGANISDTLPVLYTKLNNSDYTLLSAIISPTTTTIYPETGAATLILAGTDALLIARSKKMYINKIYTSSAGGWQQLATYSDLNSQILTINTRINNLTNLISNVNNALSDSITTQAVTDARQDARILALENA